MTLPLPGTPGWENIDWRTNKTRESDWAFVESDAAGRQDSAEDSAFVATAVKHCSALIKSAKDEIATEIWGQDRVIDMTMTCLVAGGHMLAVGMPGLAKTSLVSRVAKVMGLSSRRIQFTPDLMPADILGSEILDYDAEGKKSFRLVKGPIFTQFLLADEINRAGPRTQAALLEAMQEHKVTLAGETYHLQQPFTVMATQNPVEQEGTYPLPEAQLDRFLMRLNVDYPTHEAEERIAIETTSLPVKDLRALYERAAKGEDLTHAVNIKPQSNVRTLLGQNDLILIQSTAKSLPISKHVLDTIVNLVRSTRPGEKTAAKVADDYLTFGASPRAVQAFAFAVRARALMDGRLSPNVQDVHDVAPAILEHRVALNARAMADGVKFHDVLSKLSVKP